jgi:ATP-dependent DNA helicase RecG
VLVLQAGRLAPSHGGLILFGRDAPRQRLFPEARVSCARFRGAERVDFLDRLDIEGTVLEALEETPKFIRRNTRMAARIVTLRRQDIPEYPDIALREVLVNAVAHADYSLTGMRIRVAIYADRLEVENPGMLPFGMTLDDLKADVSRIRNRVIVRVLRELGMVEEWGTGYRRVTQACEAGGYPPPMWQELGAALRVIFEPHPDAANEDIGLNGVPVNVPVNVPINEALGERQRWLLDQLSQGQKPRAKNIAAHFDVTEKTAKRDIAGLKARGLIEFTGAPKTGFYRLAKRE